MPCWTSKDVQEWKAEARQEQQNSFTFLGDRQYDLIQDVIILKRKIGFAVYGCPGRIPEENNNADIGYSKTQNEVINNISDKIKEKSPGDVYFAALFVFGKIYKNRFTEAVFRIKRSVNSDKCYFIDSICRVYEHWWDFLNYNKYPQCMYCYPRNGIYQGDSNGNVQVDFGTSPACDLISRITTLLDGTSVVVSLCTTTIGVASLFIPVAGPVIAASVIAGTSTGVYGVGRATYSLADRGLHDQSIGLENTEARNCWLGVVGGVIGMSAGGMSNLAANMARNGDLMCEAGRIAVTVLNVGSLTVNGIGVVNGLANLIEKKEKNQLTALDIYQFSASILFFSNSLINLKSAGEIIKDVQADVLKNYRERLATEGERKMFDTLTREMRGQRVMHGNARVIKALHRIDNKDEFFRCLVDVKDQATIKLTDDGLVEINGSLKIAPLKFHQINNEFRQLILDATDKLSNGKLTVPEFKTQMQSICKSERIQFECQRNETVNRFCQAFNVKHLNEISIDGQRIFKNITPHEIDRLGTVMTNTAKNYKQELLDISIDFAKAEHCKTTKDFLSFVEFSCGYIEDAKHQKESSYQSDLNRARHEKGFSQFKFESDKGITGKRGLHFHNQSVEYFKSREGLAEMTSKFNALKANVCVENMRGSPQFRCNNAATYHYFKHKDFGSETKTVQQYFELARELTGQPIDQGKCILSQEGNCTMITFEDKNTNSFGVLIKTHQVVGGEKEGIATLFHRA